MSINQLKYSGSYFEYEEERNRDLMRAYKEQRELSGRNLSREFYRRVADSPSSRFWVSEERAAIVVANMLRGDTLSQMRPSKREMYQEIYRRYVEEHRRNPQASIYEIVFDIVSSPAPKFYLTAGSAKVIICKIKRLWYKTRRQRHCR